MRRDGTLILCYHRVAEASRTPSISACARATFAAHLEEMSRSREPSTLAEVSVPSRRPRVVVTFDDGYRDNLANALPIAESKGVPITVFVTSGILGNHNGFWWDRLGTLLRARPPHVTELDLPVGGRNVRLSLGSSGIRADLDSVRRHLLPLRVTEIERALDAVSEQWQVGSAPPADAGTLTPEEPPPAGGQRHRDDRRPHGRPRPAPGSSSTGAAGHHRWLPRGSWSSRSARPCHTSRTHSASAATSTIVRSTPCVRLGSTPRAPPSAGTARSPTDPYRLPRRGVMDWGRLRFRAQMQRVETRMNSASVCWKGIAS